MVLDGEKDVCLKESLKCCLVGQLGFSDMVTELQALKKCAFFYWHLQGEVNLSLLRGALILFELDSVEDASEVLHRGLRRFANKCLSLGRWLLEVGCFRRDIHAKEVWFRLTGLALHLWDKTLFFIFYFLIGKFLSPWDLNLDGPQSLLIPLPLEPGFKGMGQDII